MSKMKLIFFFVIILISSWGALNIEPSKISNDALSVICTIFSVLAGLILAVYALHISSIDSSTNVSNQLSAAIVWDSRKAINRLCYFFWLYLLVLAFSLIVILGKAIPYCSEYLSPILSILTQLTIGFAIFAIGLSFFVPLELQYIQERKILEAKQRKSS